MLKLYCERVLLVKDKKRVVPKKNYIKLLIMLVLVVVITLLIANISSRYNVNKLTQSYLYEYINDVNITELKNVLTEPSSELFILVTRTNDESVYKFEKDLKKLIKNNELRDNFIYIDYTNKENKMDELNKVLGDDIKTLPAVLYYKDGEFIKSIDSTDRLINVGDVQQILDNYEVN